MERLKRFVDIHIPISTCNLKCHYCYVPQSGKYGAEELEFPFAPSFIRKALSVERLGGVCLFNICGMGETLIPRQTIELTRELLQEGHFVTIVTNGTIEERFKEFEFFSSDELSRLMIKFSLHWKEFKRRGLLNVFSKNVIRMKSLGASISVEMTANDEVEDDIEEIIEYTVREFGAKCHISIPRDESKSGFALLSKHSLEEFYNIWNVFESELLDFKYSIWGVRRKEYCYAGEWSGLLNIQNGEWRSCYHSHYSVNIFEAPNKPIPFVPVGRHCAVEHCFNGHSWLTLGDIPVINSQTYAEVRDRVCVDGSHWVNEKYREFISQRLYHNNYWPHHEYEKIGFIWNKMCCYVKKGFNRIYGKM